MAVSASALMQSVASLTVVISSSRKRRVALMVVSLGLLICVSVHITMASGSLLDKAEVKDMAAANTQFALDLVRKCAAGGMKGQNVFLGPYSITTALAMTYMGARGDTAEEMKSALKWSSPEAPTAGFGSYLPLLQEAASPASKGYVLVGAQRIYVSRKMTLTGEFSKATQQHFSSEAQTADFVGQAEKERDNINSWVSGQTRGKITDLLPSGSLDSMTAMVLVQALYFKGNWMHKFDARKTQPADFFAPNGKIRVSMMQQERNFNYGKFQELGCTAVELPYASNSDNSSSHDLSMLILLPDAKDGLGQLEEQLTAADLEKVRKNLHSVKVNLKLPKFSVESSFALKDILIKLGMTLAFHNQKADFSGMVTGPDAELLYISEVFHKAVVEVNEEGTEAAAATAVRMMKRSLPVFYPFIADHPFLFFILDARADVVLFSGRLTVPPAASEAQSQGKEEL
ncbi:leukocyte elastase inhibitor-like isoform X3 [Littorina saxatilis]